MVLAKSPLFSVGHRWIVTLGLAQVRADSFAPHNLAINLQKAYGPCQLNIGFCLGFAEQQVTSAITVAASKPGHRGQFHFKDAGYAAFEPLSARKHCDFVNHGPVREVVDVPVRRFASVKVAPQFTLSPAMADPT